MVARPKSVSFKLSKRGKNITRMKKKKQADNELTIKGTTSLFNQVADKTNLFTFVVQ